MHINENSIKVQDARAPALAQDSGERLEMRQYRRNIGYRT